MRGGSIVIRRLLLVVLLAAPVFAEESVPDSPAVASAPARAERISHLLLDDEDVVTALNHVRYVTGVPVVAGEGVGGTVSIDARDVTAEEAVEMIARKRGYRVERRGEVLHVVAPVVEGFRVDLSPLGTVSVEAADAEIRPLLVEIGARTGLAVALAPEVAGKVTGVFRDRTAEAALAEAAGWGGFVVEPSAGGYRVALPAVPAPDLVLEVEDGRISRFEADDPGVPLEAFTRKVLEATGINLVPAAGTSGLVRGRLAGVPVEEGLRVVLEQSGFAVRRSGSVWRVSAGGDTAVAPVAAPGIEVSADSAGHLRIRATDADLKALLVEIAVALDTRITVPTNVAGKVPAMIEDGITIEDAFAKLLSSTAYGWTYRLGGWVVADRAAQPNQPNAVYRVEVIPFENRVAKEVKDVLSQRFPAAALRYLDDRNAVVVEGPPDIIEAVREYVRALDVAPGTVVVEAYLVEIRDQQTFTERFSLQVTGGATSLISYSPGGQTSDLSLTIDPAGTFDRSIWQATIRWLEERGAAVVSGHSVVATVPGREAELRVNTVERVQVSLPTASVNNPSIDFKEVPTGLTMTMTPYVGDNSDRIIVDLTLKDASEVGRSPQSNFPITSERQSRTRLTWESGRVTFMGSLKRRSQQNTRGQVPLLGDLPVVGRLFRSQTLDDRTTTLALFLAPRVVRGDEAEATRAEIPRTAEIVIGDDRLPVAVPATEVAAGDGERAVSREEAIRGFRRRRPTP